MLVGTSAKCQIVAKALCPVRGKPVGKKHACLLWRPAPQWQHILARLEEEQSNRDRGKCNVTEAKDDATIKYSNIAVAWH